MRFKIREFSGSYEVRRLTEADVAKMFELCKGNPQYYRYCPPAVSAETLLADLQALPPRKTPDDKYYVGYYKEGQLIALLDLIDAFPNDETAFIGFFMVRSEISGTGVGSRIVGELCEYLAGCGIRAVRLGWVEGNPQAESFWKKNGFAETGVKSQQELYTIVMGERKILMN